MGFLPWHSPGHIVGRHLSTQTPKVPEPRCGSGQKGGGQGQPFDVVHIFFDGFCKGLTRYFTKGLPRFYQGFLQGSYQGFYQGIYQGFPFTKGLGPFSSGDLIWESVSFCIFVLPAGPREINLDCVLIRVRAIPRFHGNPVFVSRVRANPTPR